MSDLRGQTVTVDAQRPELARFAGKRGRVIALNCNGRALVQFEGVDNSWYDIDPAFLEPVKEPPAVTEASSLKPQA